MDEKVIRPALYNPLYSINSQDKPTFFNYLKWKKSSLFPDRIDDFIQEQKDLYILNIYIFNRLNLLNQPANGNDEVLDSFDMCRINISLDDIKKIPDYEDWDLQRLIQCNHWVIANKTTKFVSFWWVRNIKNLGNNQLEITLEMDKWLTYWGEFKFRDNSSIDIIRTHKDRITLSKKISSQPNYDKNNYFFNWTDDSYLWNNDKKLSNINTTFSVSTKLVQENYSAYNSFYKDNKIFLIYRENEFKTSQGKITKILLNYQMYAVLSYPNDGKYMVEYDNEAVYNGTTPYPLIVVPLSRDTISDNAYSKWFDNPNLLNIIIAPFPLEEDPTIWIKASEWDTKYQGENISNTLFKDIKPNFVGRFSSLAYNNSAKSFIEKFLSSDIWNNFTDIEKLLYKDYEIPNYKNGISNVTKDSDFNVENEPKIWMEPHFNFKYNKGIRQPQKYLNELIFKLDSFIGTGGEPNNKDKLAMTCLWGINPTYSIYAYIPKGNAIGFGFSNNFYDKNFDTKYFYIYDGGFIYISNSNNLKNFFTNHSNAYKTGLEQNLNSIIGDPVKGVVGFGTAVAGGAIAGSVIPVVGTAGGAIAGAVAGLGSLVASAFATSHDVIAREQIEAQVKDLANSPETINNYTNKDIFADIVFGITQFRNENELLSGGGIITTSYLNQKNKLFVAMYYNKYGYIVNNQEFLSENENISYFSKNRLNFNFWEIHNFRNCIDMKNLNEIILNYFDEIFNKGIRLWNSDIMIGNYKKENWEITIAENEEWEV